MSDTIDYSLTPIGFIQSSLKRRREAPMQGNEGAPDAWLEMVPTVVMGLRGIAVGQDVILITWLHQARRNILKVHSRSDKNLLLTGVFATRSPDRPNPLGLHRVGNRTSCPNDSSRMPQTKYDKGTIDNIPSQEGKLAVVTGANSGIC